MTLSPRLKSRNVFAALALASLSCTVSAALIFDNGGIVTGTGNGFNGADTSALAAGASNLGFSPNSTGVNTFRLADDFTLSTGAIIDGITFLAYSTSAYPFPPVSPFTSLSVNIWDAQPGSVGASIIGSSTTLDSTSWTGVYRVVPATPTDAQRPVFTLAASFPGVLLGAGTYWADWAVTGIAAPGVASSIFSPPVMTAGGALQSGNAIQFAASWNPISDLGAGIQVALPFSVIGTPIPERSTYGVLTGFGLLGMAMVRVHRRRKTRVT